MSGVGPALGLPEACLGYCTARSPSYLSPPYPAGQVARSSYPNLGIPPVGPENARRSLSSDGAAAPWKQPTRNLNDRDDRIIITTPRLPLSCVIGLQYLGYMTVEHAVRMARPGNGIGPFEYSSMLLFNLILGASGPTWGRKSRYLELQRRPSINVNNITLRIHKLLILVPSNSLEIHS